MNPVPERLVVHRSRLLHAVTGSRGMMEALMVMGIADSDMDTISVLADWLVWPTNSKTA